MATPLGKTVAAADMQSNEVQKCAQSFAHQTGTPCNVPDITGAPSAFPSAAMPSPFHWNIYVSGTKARGSENADSLSDFHGSGMDLFADTKQHRNRYQKLRTKEKHHHCLLFPRY